jgi:hypothetical protein
LRAWRRGLFPPALLTNNFVSHWGKAGAQGAPTLIRENFDSGFCFILQTKFADFIFSRE